MSDKYTDLNAVVCKLLKMHLKKVKISLTTVGEKLGITQGMVSRYLNGDVDITYKMLCIIINMIADKNIYQISVVRFQRDVETILKMGIDDFTISIREFPNGEKYHAITQEVDLDIPV